METTVQEVLNSDQSQLKLKLTLQETLETYSHITLTDDEFTEAMIWAKRKKEESERVRKFKEAEDERRKIRSMQWNYTLMNSFMMNRAEKMFGVDFSIDEHNERVFDALCYYVLEDEQNFVSVCEKIGVKNPSLKKGIMIPGTFGSGKTWLMQLFSRNKRVCFDILNSKEIAEEFLASKEKKIPEYLVFPFDTQSQNGNRGYNSADVFGQRYIGLCLDDLGSESAKNNFGNTVNVIGDLIEYRYSKGYTGVFLHATTNLTADQLKQFYGERVLSRMREIFNFIKLDGSDRRK